MGKFILSLACSGTIGRILARAKYCQFGSDSAVVACPLHWHFSVEKHPIFILLDLEDELS